MRPNDRKKPMTTPAALPEIMDDPRPTFGRCPACRGTVLLRQWREGAWIECQTPLSPVLGQPHQCQNVLPPPLSPGRSG